eukprot:TRINITY_DN575_c5_g1_i1.p1 TRINITY_DN575_c5_g1~~TRINITY_DN575_c5_g1_i1.p1  ORF type:complete len:414 (+),score=152.63 TRINITY_DN575_c5_g1_i1:97-1338(+)
MPELSDRQVEVKAGLNRVAESQLAVQQQAMDDIPWEELRSWTELPPLAEGEEMPDWRRRLEDPEGWRECPLFMEGEIGPDAGEKNPQVAALQDILYNEMGAEERAERCKLQGNEAMKQAQAVLSGSTAPGIAGPRGGWRTALAFYSEGIAAKPQSTELLAALLANRAQAHLCLENYGHCVADCQDSLRLRQDVKCCFRAAKACNAVKKPERALQFCRRGLQFPGEAGNKALLAQQREAESLLRRLEAEQRELLMARRKKAVDWHEAVQVMRDHGIKLGKPELCSEHWEQYGGMAPRLEDGELHFSVLFIYDEHQQSDLVQDALMEHSLADHIAMMFPPQGPPAPWDDQGRYHAAKLTAFYQEMESRRKVEVDINTDFSELLRSEGYVCPGFVPTFHIIPRDAHYAQLWRRGED